MDKNNLHSSLKMAIKEEQTTNNDSTPIISNIQDVIILKPTIHVDNRGRLFEICSGTNDYGSFWEKPIVYCYMFSIRPNQVKGWGIHEFKDDRYTLISGEVLIVLYDVRPDSKTFEKIQKVYLRLTPGIDAHTHEFISTAHEDVKFGFSIASGAASEALDKCMSYPSLNLAGVHCHIGSQIFEVSGFEAAAMRLIDVLAKFRDQHAKELPELNIGGGYGIAYTKGERAIAPDEVIPAIAKVIKSACDKLKLSIPKISIEPGRAIVGPTTTTIYLVGTTKSVTLEDGSIRKYVSVDGGMSENIRPALYGATYSAFLANRSSTAKSISTRVVGKHCESGDILISDIQLPSDIKIGDLLAIPATGAYGRSMASNYNHIPRPSVIAVLNGSAREILRRETQADLLNLDVIQAPRQLS